MCVKHSNESASSGWTFTDSFTAWCLLAKETLSLKSSVWDIRPFKGKNRKLRSIQMFRKHWAHLLLWHKRVRIRRPPESLSSNNTEIKVQMHFPRLHNKLRHLYLYIFITMHNNICDTSELGETCWTFSPRNLRKRMNRRVELHFYPGFLSTKNE